MIKVICLLILLNISITIEAANPKAIVQTTMGNFTILLFQDKVPNTVNNFIKLVDKDFYNGIIFHRVIKDFMSQTGDPTGTGRGGCGYTFKDEFDPSLRHSKAGIVSMANRGPDTNGSQFFITAVPTPHLDDKHSIFGEIIKGMDVCNKINSCEVGANDKPLKDIQIIKIDIIKEFSETEKTLASKALIEADTLLKENYKLFQKESPETSLDDIKNKGDLFLFIWKINFSDQTKARFWIKAKRTDDKFNFLEYHFNLK